MPETSDVEAVQRQRSVTSFCHEVGSYESSPGGAGLMFNLTKLRAVVRHIEEQAREIERLKAAGSSAGEHQPYKLGDAGANPAPPTIYNRTPRDTYRCERCGFRDGLDASLPREQWAAVAAREDGGEWGLLCLWCIDEIATVKGMEPVTAYLYFVGETVHSALYEGDNDERWPQLLTARDAEIDRLRGLLREAAEHLRDTHEACPLAEKIEEALQ